MLRYTPKPPSPTKSWDHMTGADETFCPATKSGQHVFNHTDGDRHRVCERCGYVDYKYIYYDGRAV